MNKVTILPGALGVKDAYKEALEADKLDVICLAQSYKSVIGDFFDKQVDPKLRKKRVREVIPNKSSNKKYQAESQTDLYKIGLLNDSKTSETDMIITVQAVYLFSFNIKQPYALILTEKEIVKKMKILFEQVWSACSK